MISLLTVLNMPHPKWLSHYQIGWLPTCPLAAIFLIFCTWIQTRGSKSAGNFNTVVTSTKLAILLFIISVSFLNFDSNNFKPFLNEEKGATGVIEASSILFFGYLGFDFITTLSAETIDPQINVPKAINYSVLGSMLIYALIAFSINGVGNLAAYSGQDGETALADIFTGKGMPHMAFLIYFCALFGITAATMTNIMSQARVMYAYAKDGLFFPVFKELDPITKVPAKGSWLVMIPISLAAFVFDLEQAAKICALANLVTYAFIDAGIMALRLREAPKR